MSSPNQSFSEPFAQQTPNDFRVKLWVAVLLCLAFVTITSITRVHVRWRSSGLDDYMIAAACFAGLAQYILVIVGLVGGLGVSATTLTESQTQLSGRIFLASEALMVLTIFLSKNAVLLAIERLLARDMRGVRIALYGLHGVVAVCALASLIAVTAGCSADALLLQSMTEMCPSQLVRWEAVTIIDSVTEVAIFAVFCWLIMPLQMKLKLKLTVIMLLGLRIGCVAFSSVHTYYISTYVSSANPGVGVVAPLVWQQIALSYALFSALAIALKSFFQSFDMDFGIGRTYAEGTRPSDNGSGFRLRNLTKGKGGSKSMKTWEHKSQVGVSEDETINRPDGPKYTAQIFHAGEHREGSVRSGISQHPIIRCDVQYSVSHEDRDSE